MIRLLIPICLTLLLFACGGDNRHDWLHGDWVLTYNPQRDSQDTLRFEPSGKVYILVSSEKPDIRGRYQVSDEGLDMLLNVDDRIVEAHFDISPDRSRLIYHNGAYYTKR